MVGSIVAHSAGTLEVLEVWGGESDETMTHQFYESSEDGEGWPWAFAELPAFRALHVGTSIGLALTLAIVRASPRLRFVDGPIADRLAAAMRPEAARSFRYLAFDTDWNTGRAHVEHDALSPATLRGWPSLECLDTIYVDLTDALADAMPSTVTTYKFRRAEGVEVLLQRLADRAWLPRLSDLQYQTDRDVDWSADEDDMDPEDRVIVELAQRLQAACEDRSIEFTFEMQCDYEKGYCARRC